MSDVLLTLDQVNAWKREREELASRLATIDAKLNAASLFMGGLGNDESDPAQDVEPDDLSLGDAIVAVLKGAAGAALSNKEIKSRLSSLGFSPDQFSTNYYYTATKRLSDKGTITKHRDGKYSMPENSDPAGSEEANAEEDRTLFGVQNSNPSPFG